MANSSYHPGTAPVETIREMSGNLFAIDSFRGEAKSYIINVECKTCDCPHFTNRLAGTGRVCKHITAIEQHLAEMAERAASYRELELKAGSVSDEALASLLLRYEALGRWDVCIAIRGEQFDRASLEAPAPLTLVAIMEKAKAYGRKVQSQIAADASNAALATRLDERARAAADARLKSIFA